MRTDDDGVQEQEAAPNETSARMVHQIIKIQTVMMDSPDLAPEAPDTLDGWACARRWQCQVSSAEEDPMDQDPTEVLPGTRCVGVRCRRSKPRRFTLANSLGRRLSSGYALVVHPPPALGVFSQPLLG